MVARVPNRKSSVLQKTLYGGARDGKRSQDDNMTRLASRRHPYASVHMRASYPSKSRRRVISHISWRGGQCHGAYISRPAAGRRSIESAVGVHSGKKDLADVFSVDRRGGWTYSFGEGLCELFYCRRVWTLPHRELRNFSGRYLI